MKNDAMIANLLRAAFDNENVVIGGGVFKKRELLDAAKDLERMQILQDVLTDVWNRWDEQDDQDASELGRRIQSALGLPQPNEPGAAEGPKEEA